MAERIRRFLKSWWGVALFLAIPFGIKFALPGNSYVWLRYELIAVLWAPWGWTLLNRRRLNARSQLRALLVIWMAAGLTWIVGYCATIAIFVFAIYEAVKLSFSDAATFVCLGLFVLVAGLQIALTVLLVGIRDRFEDRCWELIKADGGASVEMADAYVLRRQADGSDARLAAVQARRSQQFYKRLRVLIERAWPRSPP